MATKQDVIEALRSGTYKQTAGYLHRGDAFCAEGVVCDLIDPTKWVMVEGSSNPAYAWDELIAWGPHHRLVPVIGLAAYTYMATCNDHGASFAQIADALETGEWVELMEELNIRGS
jgi:hypothetical protein